MNPSTVSVDTITSSCMNSYSLGPIADISVIQFPCISLWDLFGGFNTRFYTLVHGFCFFKLLYIGPKEF